MEPAPKDYRWRLRWITIGVIVGVFTCLWLRVLYYELMQFEPNMAPQIAYLFAPVMIVPLLLIATFFEAGFSKYWFVVPGRGANVLLGASYASIVIALLPPTGALLFLITNPLVARWLLRRWSRRGAAAV